MQPANCLEVLISTFREFPKRGSIGKRGEHGPDLVDDLTARFTSNLAPPCTCKSPAKSHRIRRNSGQARSGLGSSRSKNVRVPSVLFRDHEHEPRSRSRSSGLSLHVTTTLAHHPQTLRNSMWTEYDLLHKKRDVIARFF